MNVINVKSEIGPLKKVLLHRPGNELLNLTPDTLSRLLFDDIPFLPEAQKEHDEFAHILKENGIEVVYLEDLMAEVLSLSEEISDKFIRQFIYEAGIRTPKYKNLVFDYLKSFKNKKELVLKTMEGIKIGEISRAKRNVEQSLVDFVGEESDFLADPMPNLYFTRDPFASAGNGIILNKMYSVTRSRETIYAEYIFNYHPEYKDMVNKYYDRYLPYHIEGGDVLNLNNHILAVGISQRTEAGAIDELAKNLFKNPDCEIDTILAFNIPESRAFMHLDTVFTQIDYDKFTYHPGIMDTLQVFEITEGDIPDSDEDLNVIELNGSLEEILEKYLKRKITLIPCAGGEKISAEREQWNDGTNTLCIAPGVVVVYDRNNITNNILREHGIKVYEMSSAELSRGRGGPRCMSMPLIRDDIDNEQYDRNCKCLLKEESIKKINNRIDLRGRNFLTLLDYTPEEIRYLLDLSKDLKEKKHKGIDHRYLKGKNIVLLFEKTSTRTRCSFEVAGLDLGMGVTYLDPGSSQMGKKESIADTAKVLGRMYDGIEYRGFSQKIVEELAKNAGVPVWNGLTTEFHPTQMLGDALTIEENFGHLQGIKLVFMGDNRNNVANSLMVISAKMGMNFVSCGPKELWPDEDLVKKCKEIAQETGASIEMTEDVKEATKEADVIYTDVWVSMGEPDDVWESKIKLLKPYQVNMDVMNNANKNAIFLHCLPSFHDLNTTIGKDIHEKFGLKEMEVTDEVFNSSKSKVFDEAENRLHTIKAVVYATMREDNE
ncbi:arginine deiminase [Firmicutes bacterium CAG:884]|mgnify:FL=1|nr:arginine deiminase [Firmicutes bacterium CAG:884]